jgi:hypothetical protein
MGAYKNLWPRRIREQGAAADGGEISTALADHLSSGRTWTATLLCSDARLCPIGSPTSSFNRINFIDDIVERQVVKRNDQVRYKESVFYDD